MLTSQEERDKWRNAGRVDNIERVDFVGRLCDDADTLARIRQGIKTQVTAENLHEIYERLALDFGYETREETRDFDPNTPNGKLMMAVCAEIRLALLRGEGEE